MMMDPATLDSLLLLLDVDILPNGLRLVVPHSWIVADEDRLSYSSAIRLAECCREHHWKQDLASIADKLDSVVVQCNASFASPVITGSHIEVRYAITRVGSRSYDCTICICPVGSEVSTSHVQVVLTNVFYDPVSRGAIDPPPRVVAALLRLLNVEATA